MEKVKNPKNIFFKEKERVKKLKIYETAIRHSLTGFALLKLIYKNSDISDLIFIEVNVRFHEIFRTGGADITGKSIAEVLPDLSTGTDFWRKALQDLIEHRKPRIYKYYISYLQQWIPLQLVPSGKRTILLLIYHIPKERSDENRKELNPNKNNVPINNRISSSEIKLSDKTSDKMDDYDPLTNLHNIKFFKDELKNINKAQLHPISLVIASVNGLSLIKDAFGASHADRLLNSFADSLKHVCRTGDRVARIGEDEFILLLPLTNGVQAEKVAERIKVAVDHVTVDKIKLSVSVGYKTKYSETEAFDELIKPAREAMYSNRVQDWKNYSEDIVKAATETLYEKSPREKRHSEKVSMICKNIASALGMDSEKVMELGLAGLLHDIGKIGISGNILNKCGNLNEEEWIEIRRHPEYGYHILSTLYNLSDIAQYVLAHHERPDGEGYPKGLGSEEIPYQSKILMLAEAFEEMTGDNGYHLTLSIKEAICELRKHSGAQFDSDLVSIFVEKVLKEE